ncbi:phage distal tail protein [Kitasatospora sp. NPDC004289]
MAGELVTGPGLIQWGTLLLGRSRAGGVATTSYRWSSISGWEDTPSLDSGTQLRAQQHGAWPGRQLAQTRIITLDGLMVRVPAGQIGTAVQALSAATPIGVDDEAPLVVQLDERGPLLVYARVIRRQLPVDPRWQLGHSAGGAIQFECTDPRRYSLTEQVATTALPQPESGLSWGSPSETGLAWGSPSETGLVWGTPGSTGDLLCLNSGDAPVHPVIEIRGPVTTPALTLLGTEVVLEYDLVLGASDVLVVDTWAPSVLLGGQSRIGYATSRSQPEGSLTLPPGTSTVTFRSADPIPDPAASATVRWRSAYW